MLRTRDDAAELQQRLAWRARRVLVIGAGFTGCEVASACRGRDLPVTMIERGPTPLGGALGGSAQWPPTCTASTASTCAAVPASPPWGDSTGRLRRAHLSDGTAIDADVAVVALGAVRSTEWLQGY
ncbi:FAD-dependent oxidoreductase [Saccharopolyspora hattusasensis]|uniref:FAD-dependent oxidoreductase n=1 Tax=Saccharopolyspora hattusasensis TaxID=1128679 RepID=UPI003D98D649